MEIGLILCCNTKEQLNVLIDLVLFFEKVLSEVSI